MSTPRRRLLRWILAALALLLILVGTDVTDLVPASAPSSPPSSASVPTVVSPPAAVIDTNASTPAQPVPEDGVGVIEQACGWLGGPISVVLPGQGRIRGPNYDPTAVGSCVAAETEIELPSVIYREGTPRPGNLLLRASDKGALSFRDSLS